MRAVTLPVLIMLAALSACGGAKGDGPERKTAAGEVLGGSISDAMLPLDTVQSQSPPLPASGTDETDGEEGDADARPASDASKPAAAATPEASSSAPAAPASTSAAPAAED